MLLPFYIELYCGTAFSEGLFACRLTGEKELEEQGMNWNHYQHFQCGQAESHNQIRTSGLVPVLTAKLVTTASATNLLPHRHPLALFFCPLFSSTHPIFPPSSSGTVLHHVSKPNPVMLASPLPGPGWLMHFHLKGRFSRKRRPAVSSPMPFILSHSTHSQHAPHPPPSLPPRPLFLFRSTSAKPGPQVSW